MRYSYEELVALTLRARIGKTVTFEVEYDNGNRERFFGKLVFVKQGPAVEKDGEKLFLGDPNGSVYIDVVTAEGTKTFEWSGIMSFEPRSSWEQRGEAKRRIEAEKSAAALSRPVTVSRPRITNS